MIDSLGINSTRGFQLNSAIGYIYIPKEVERDLFVETCMRKGLCSVFREGSFGVLNNVRIGVEEIQLIDWPTQSGKMGSPVVMVLEPYSKTYNVVAVLNGLGQFLKAKEGIRIISKESSNGRVTITLDSTRPTIQVLTEGGDVELIAREGSVLIDGSEVVKISSPRIEHNEAKEPMLLGDQTTSLIEELLDLLVKARVATSIGLQPLNNFLEIEGLKKKLDDIKSQKSFLE